MHSEARLLQKTAVPGGRWEERRGGRLGVYPEGSEREREGGPDGSDIALASHLGDEAGAGLEGAADGGEGSGLIRRRNPVESCVREGGIEAAGECGLRGKIGDAAVQDVEAASTGGLNHAGRGIDAGDDGSGGGEFFGEGSVAAADVEDVFPEPWKEEIDDARGKVGHEAAVRGVSRGVPALAGRRRPRR